MITRGLQLFAMISAIVTKPCCNPPTWGLIDLAVWRFFLFVETDKQKARWEWNVTRRTLGVDLMLNHGLVKYTINGPLILTVALSVLAPRANLASFFTHKPAFDPVPRLGRVREEVSRRFSCDKVLPIYWNCADQSRWLMGNLRSISGTNSPNPKVMWSLISVFQRGCWLLV